MNENDDKTTSDASSCCYPQKCFWAGDGRILPFDGHGGKIGNEMVGWNGSTCWTAC